MSKSEIKQQEGTLASSPRRVESVAEAILAALDGAGEAPIEHSDPVSRGRITVQRSGDRVHIRAPREIRVSVQMEVRKNRVLWTKNRNKLAAFLNKNPLALTFLESVF